MLSVRSREARRLNVGVQLESGEGKEKAVILQLFLGDWRGQCHHPEEQDGPTIGKSLQGFYLLPTEPLCPPPNPPAMVTPNRMMAFRSRAFGR